MESGAEVECFMSESDEERPFKRWGLGYGVANMQGDVDEDEDYLRCVMLWLFCQSFLRTVTS